MKKVLLTTSALTLLAGAAAELTLVAMHVLVLATLTEQLQTTYVTRSHLLDLQLLMAA